jgi:sortase A
MALYCYVKAPLANSQALAVSLPAEGWLKTIRFLPLTFIFIGLFLITLVVYPLLHYRLNLKRWQDESLVVPVPELAVAEAKGFITPLSSKVAQNSSEGPEVINDVDYNVVSNWFPSSVMPAVRPSKVTHYTMSIPKLRIDKAVVTIGGTRLFDTLVQYAGTANPGEYGNTVIFGHSVLPTFYNPKDYKTIFSLIPTLEKGDKILVDFDGMEFVYIVENYFEVKPDEVDVLQQRFDQQLLSLVTCVPPGTYQLRGVLQSRLQPNEQ